LWYRKLSNFALQYEPSAKRSFAMAIDPAKVRSIFIQAIEGHSPEEWDGYLESACGGDLELRRRAEALLKAHVGEDAILDQGLLKPDIVESNRNNPKVTEAPGTLIGPYKLLELIGEGGFGVVYMAEQQQPVRRKVALKVVKPGMDSKQVIARFEAERQALALMDHPNIAKVLDAGATDTGRPYFVMELVRGIPITDLCDQNQLPVRERLELFVAVCQAVQHAHQKGIIHRDLKPSNVLVTLQDGMPVVKVIDFGIAKALGQERLTDKTVFTGFAQMLGTPLYMSPEQAEMSGQDVDTRTDIYALGVLLYELLTGTTPFDKERLKEASYDELRRIIREEEPAKPSTRISTLGQAATTVSANRKSEPRRLSRLFRGELDWIVMKALEKDRNRRYDTASSFAVDVQGYLDDEPVQACPPSAVYRFRKFARRNKGALITASAIALAVLLAMAGLAVSSGLIWQANQELRHNLYYQHIALADREWSANNLSRMEQLLEECPPDLRGWEWHYLKRLPYASLSGLRHDSTVLRVAFSPTGQCFASGSADGMIRLWDGHTGRLLRTIPAHGHRIFSLAFSPDGERLASGSVDTFLRIWNVRTGERLHSWVPHGGDVSNLAFGSDGRLLASGGGKKITGEQHNSEVKIWDAASGQMLRVLPGGPFLALSPDGTRLATCTQDCGDEIEVWDTTTGNRLLSQKRLDFPKEAATYTTSIAFSPDGRYLAAACGDWWRRADGEIRVWDAETGRLCHTLRGHTGFLVSIAFSPDSRRIASGGMDSTVKLWDVASGREVLTLRGRHKELIQSVAFSPDGRKLISASDDRTVQVWDATPLSEDAPSGPLTLHGHRAGVFGVAFHPDSGRLATASADGTVKVWDLHTQEVLFTFPAHGKTFHKVAFSPDGQRLAAAGDPGELTVWDTTSGQELLSEPGLIHVMFGVAFSPNGRFFVSAGGDTNVRIWNSNTGALIQEIPKAHSYVIVGLAISPDGRHIATVAVDNKVKIWDVATGRQPGVTLAPDHPGTPTSVAFRPDGQLLASASEDGTIKLWDTQTWQQKQTLRDPTAGVRCLAFSPDSRFLAWGSTDTTVKVWQAATDEIRTLRGHTSWVESVAFSPDGQHIASGSLDGTVKLWSVNPGPEPPSQ
jgi:WD40 repeat protein/serine/threonine protein kinase